VLIPDVSAYYVQQNMDKQAERSSDREDCPDAFGSTGFTPEIPVNFETGSMAGYFTYEEYLAQLDSMVLKYPDLITAKQGISDFTSHEDRPIYWVKISDNPTMDEDENEVLYTAIHHAREPMSLSQTIFYMWYLLENYSSSEEIEFLVNNTEMYFVPMINPDGYKYNQTTDPAGGGMHRKNRNPEIGDFNAGVDLNRNYDYHWNEAGTSPSENGDTYAGTGPFSEPETQAIKWFCENHSFLFASNAHSHGDLVLYPFGWATDAYADDADYYSAYSNHMALYNGYIAQKSSDLYPAAGDSDDWMYDGDLDAHDAVYAITPEIGHSFWPPVSAILPTCQEMVWNNKTMAHLTHVYGTLEDLNPNNLSDDGYLVYELTRLGLEDGEMEISVTPLLNIATVGDANTHNLSLMEEKIDSIVYTLAPSIAFGDEIKYVLHLDNGDWVKHDTITKIYGAYAVLFEDDLTDYVKLVGRLGTH
jgi:carboxypeptidase T